MIKWKKVKKNFYRFEKIIIFLESLENSKNKLKTTKNPKGAFYCIAKLPIDNADKFCQWLLESFNYNMQTVMLAPATGFYSTPNAGTNEVRIAYVLNLNDLKNAMECLNEALKKYPGKTNL